MSQNDIWRSVLGEIEIVVSPSNFQTWFKRTTLIDSSGETAIIGVYNSFMQNTLEGKFKELIISTLRKQGQNVDNLKFKVISPSKDPSLYKEMSEESPEQTFSEATLSETTLAPLARNMSLNSRYTLENFVVGENNKLAYDVSIAAIKDLGSKFNPLHIYGGVGIGKTHLVQALGNEIQQKNPDAKVLYINAEQFSGEFVRSIKSKKIVEFSQRFRSVDVLIIDDVQFFAGKDKIQAEFFHTFNTLHQSNKQIIMTSDVAPQNIELMEERLSSRLAGGMMVDMQIPDYEMRCAIIETKTASSNIHLDSSIVEYLAKNIKTNIRELEGILNHMLALCEVRNEPPSLELASSLLSSKSVKKRVSIKQIIEQTARYYKLPIEDILGPKRDKDIVVPRQIAMFMLHEELKLSYPKIAKELGRKDHTTAMHSVRKIAREYDYDTMLRDSIKEIKEQIYA